MQEVAIKQVNEFLRESEGVIKIEDVLPLFPDFVKIDNFKDAICQSLEDYNIFVGQFPNSLWAGAKFPHRDEYFKGSAGNSVAPTVDFGK